MPVKPNSRSTQSRCLHRVLGRTRCHQLARPSGYCEVHERLHFPDGWQPGTAESGPGLGAIAVAADFYASGYTVEELAGAPLKDLESSSLDAEIRLLRTQIKRVALQIKRAGSDPDFNPLEPFAAEQEVDNVPIGPDGRPAMIAQTNLDGSIVRGADGQPIMVPAHGHLKRRTVQRAPDLWGIQDRLMNRLRSLIELRADMAAAGQGPVDPYEHAGRIQGYLRALDDVTHGRSNGSL